MMIVIIIIIISDDNDARGRGKVTDVKYVSCGYHIYDNNPIKKKGEKEVPTKRS
jgi:hypothetical protein